jgi:hypothetical protein
MAGAVGAAGMAGTKAVAAADLSFTADTVMEAMVVDTVTVDMAATEVMAVIITTKS